MKPFHEYIYCVFACDTNEKYKDQINKIEEIWNKDAEGVDRKDAEGVDRKDAEGPESIDKLLFIVGDSGPLDGDHYIRVENVGNNHLSAADKKYLGMKYIYENYDFNFLYICSITDTTFVSVNDVKKCVLEKNIYKNDFLVLGERGGSLMFREVNVHYLSKDTGILLTKPTVKSIYPQLHTLQEEWRDVCNACNYFSYISAFNFSISYFLKMYNIRFIHASLNRRQK